MFNASSHTQATPDSLSAVLFSILETLLMVDLRDELVVENADGQADGAYHYGL